MSMKATNIFFRICLMSHIVSRSFPVPFSDTNGHACPTWRATIVSFFFQYRIQAGQYEDAHLLLNDLLKLEEESLGARTDKLADIYQLMSKTKSEVRVTRSICELMIAWHLSRLHDVVTCCVEFRDFFDCGTMMLHYLMWTLRLLFSGCKELQLRDNGSTGTGQGNRWIL